MKSTTQITAEIQKLQNEYPVALKKEARDFVNKNHGKWFERSGDFYKILGLSDEFFVLTLRVSPVWKGIEITHPIGHFDFLSLQPVNADYYRLTDAAKLLQQVLEEIG